MSTSRHNPEEVRELLNTVTCEISDYKTAITNSKRECVRLLDDSMNIGSATLSELDTQGERLDAISDNLHKVESSIYKAEKTVGKMEWRDKHPFLSFFIGKRLKKPKWFGGTVDSDLTETNISSTNNETLSVRGLSSRAVNGDDIADDNVFVDTVKSKVNVLKNMALNMSNELDRQNVKIGEIIAHTEHVTEHVDKTRNRVGKLIVK